MDYHSYVTVFLFRAQSVDVQEGNSTTTKKRTVSTSSLTNCQADVRVVIRFLQERIIIVNAYISEAGSESLEVWCQHQ